MNTSAWRSISVSPAAVGVTRQKSKELSRKQSQQLELLESELRKEIRDGELQNSICRKTSLFPSYFNFHPYVVMATVVRTICIMEDKRTAGPGPGFVFYFSFSLQPTK